MVSFKAAASSLLPNCAMFHVHNWLKFFVLYNCGRAYMKIYENSMQIQRYTIHYTKNVNKTKEIVTNTKLWKSKRYNRDWRNLLMDEISGTESIAVSACMRNFQSLLEFKDTTSKFSKSFTFVTILTASVNYSSCNNDDIWSWS